MSRSGLFQSLRVTRQVVRAFAVPAPKRLGGASSAIPTWTEQGLDVVEGTRRGVVGPKNLGDAEVTYWSDKLAEAVKTDEWAAENLKRNHWQTALKTGAEAKRFLDAHYEELRSTLANLRAAK